QLKRLEELQGQREDAKKRLAELGKAPTQAQLNQWRRLYQDVQHTHRQTAHTLRLALRLQRALDVQWQTDGGQVQTGTADSDTDLIIDGTQTISVVLPGVGCLEVAGSGSEARKQQTETEAKARSLESQL